MSKIGGPSLSMVENNVSASSAAVGHYKGVMLCNRPFGGTVVTQKSSQSDSKAVFGAGVVPAPIGSNVPISGKEKQTKRPKKDSVLVKHKKWLSDLQKTKERLEEQYLDDMRRKEEERQKFQTDEKKMREVSRTILRPSDSEADAKADAKGYGPETDTNSAKAAAMAAVKKPVWAMSESQAQLISDAKDQAEEDDLLDFAKSLDYDRFIADMEVKVMVEKLRERIQELERDVDQEKEREVDAETRAARREMLELMGKAESRLSHAQDFSLNGNNVDSEALQNAKVLLGEEEDIQAVHSTKSVVQLLKNAKDKIQSVQQQVRPPPSYPAEPKVANEPKVVIHEPNQGARMEEKKSVNKLPYMHRNPAV